VGCFSWALSIDHQFAFAVVVFIGEVGETVAGFLIFEDAVHGFVAVDYWVKKGFAFFMWV